jgi:hypothetical protein
MTSGVSTGDTQASRMADFGRFAGVAGAALDLPHERIETALALSQQERDALVLEDDPLLDLLTRWIQLGNAGKEVTAQTLLTELTPMMHALGIEPYPSSRVLAYRLRDKADAMATVILVKRHVTRSKATTYSFSLTP